MTTTKGSPLDDHKMQYEDMLPNEHPKGKKIKVKIQKPPKIKKAKRPNIIKTYIKCMIETILA